MKKEILLERIRELVSSHYFGVMSTQGENFPLGSLVRYSLDNKGQPVFLLSRIAEHSKNLKSCEKAGLFILEQTDNKQENIQELPRINLQGTIESISEEHPEQKECLETYFAYFPETKKYFETLDFDLYRLHIEHCHFVGGFAAAHQASGEEFRVANPLDFEERQAIISHMNKDHEDAIVHYCQKGSFALEEHKPEICTLDSKGFQVRIGSHIERINFDKPVTDRTSARNAFVALAKSG